MNSYPLITNVFTAVLQQSQTIEGRLFISYRGGREINADNVGTLLTEVLMGVTHKKYPLALMMAPVMIGDFADGEWNEYRVTMFFLRTSYYDGYQIAAINENTQTSTRPVVEDWSDMAQAAVMFIRVLNRLVYEPQNNIVIRMMNSDNVITPVSLSGADRASGVRLDFGVSVFVGCDLLDYDNDGITAFINNFNIQL